MFLLTRLKVISIFLLTVSLFFLTSFSTPILASTQQVISTQSWYKDELVEKKSILEAFWNKRIIQYNKESIDNFKSELINSRFPVDPQWSKEIDAIFQNTVSQKINFNLFYDALKDQPLVVILSMNDVEKLVPTDQFEEINPTITHTDLKNLARYTHDKHLSASTVLGEYGKLIIPHFSGNQLQATFAMHSVGKVFTGILAFIMMRENIISEEDLKRPVQLDPHVIQQLPPSVRNQLSKITLYQLMTHRAGLGDYLENYCSAISQGHIPIIKRTEDFLPFVEDKVFPIGEYRYSNAGMLLVGLAIQHAYEKKFHRRTDYNDILKRYLIQKVGMPSFSAWKPDNGKFNANDAIAPYIVGSPAGGYWVSAEDLAKFGQWLYNKSYTDPAFKKLIETYGQEFYYPDRHTIVHAGGIPSSMAFFSVSLKTGAIISMLSDQPPAQASDLKEMIIEHIFSKKV